MPRPSGSPLHSPGDHASSRRCPVACWRRLSIPVMSILCLGLPAGLVRLSHNCAVTGGSSSPVLCPPSPFAGLRPTPLSEDLPSFLTPPPLPSFTDVSPSKTSCTSKHVLGAALGRTQAKQRPPSRPLPGCLSYANWGILESDFSLYAGHVCAASWLGRPRGSDGHCFLTCLRS